MVENSKNEINNNHRKLMVILIFLIVITFIIFILYKSSQILEINFVLLFLITIFTGGLGFFVIVYLVMNKKNKLHKKLDQDHQPDKKEKNNKVLAPSNSKS